MKKRYLLIILILAVFSVVAGYVYKISNKLTYNQYLGQWITEIQSRNLSAKDTAPLVIYSIKDGILKGSVNSISQSFQRVAVVHFEGKIKNNKVNFTFDNDGFDNQGKGVLSLKGDKIDLDITITQRGKMANWEITEGHITFIKSPKVIGSLGAEN